MPTSLQSADLSPRIKVWLVWKGGFLMGPNYFHFLEAVEREGTIRRAGAAVGWSYRTCLNRIRRMEAVLGAPVLTTTRGGKEHGSARLTTQARQLVRMFARWRKQMHRLSDRSFRQIRRRRR